MQIIPNPRPTQSSRSDRIWIHSDNSDILMTREWDLAKWLEGLTATAKVAIVLDSILQHSGIRGVADEAMLYKLLFTKSHFMN